MSTDPKISTQKEVDVTTRKKYHEEWKTQETPLTPVLGLYEEKSDALKKYKRATFLGVVFFVSTVLGMSGMVELEHPWMLPLIALITGSLLVAAFALKAGVKDIEYMIEAEEEIIALKGKLDSYEKKDTA